MSKNIIVGIVILVIIVLGSFAYFSYNAKNHALQQALNAPAKSAPVNVFSSIADALSKKMSIACDFTDSGGRHIVSYIKNGAVHADISGKTPDESGSVIIRDNKIYYWNSTIAMVMAMPTGNITPGSNNQQATSAQDMIKSMNAYKQFCKPAVIADSLFTPPSDRNFTDASHMMVPSSGGTNPTASQPNPSNYQQYMQQYQQYMQK